MFQNLICLGWHWECSWCTKKVTRIRGEKYFVGRRCQTEKRENCSSTKKDESQRGQEWRKKKSTEKKGISYF